MFHCNGWCFPWSISVKAGLHVCLRQVRAKPIFDLIAEHKVTHMCGAPIVMSILLNARDDEKRPLPHVVRFFTAAAPPPAAVLREMGEAGFEVTHLYGLTEVYGPAVVNDWKEEWNALDHDAQAHLKARQGVRYHALEALDVMDPETMQSVPADGETMGEVMFRGDVAVKGYLKTRPRKPKALAGGWFHSGDLGVKHKDGYVQLRDRSKDIIISGGENISSIEVEDALFEHPGVQLAAVVARPDDKWGETPCAFVEMKPGHSATSDELIEWCRARLARFKCPRHVVFAEISKTSTGKVQKFALRSAPGLSTRSKPDRHAPRRLGATLPQGARRLREVRRCAISRPRRRGAEAGSQRSQDAEGSARHRAAFPRLHGRTGAGDDDRAFDDAPSDGPRARPRRDGAVPRATRASARGSRAAQGGDCARTRGGDARPPRACRQGASSKARRDRPAPRRMEPERSRDRGDPRRPSPHVSPGAAARAARV